MTMETEPGDDAVSLRVQVSRQIDVLEILTTTRENESLDAALVLTAAGIPHSRVYRLGVHRLLVDEEHYHVAREELAAFREENALQKPDHPVAVRRAEWWPGVLAYAAFLIIIFSLERYPEITFPFKAAGRMDALAVQDGAWFRTVTALTLHADFTHIIGNLFFGAVFGALLAQVVGNGVAWGTIAVSGALGNTLNSVLRTENHFAVGASTAVFGALGALVTWQWVYGRSAKISWPKRLAPAAMGLVLLTYIGAGGENTDVLAHVYGFLAGAALGYLHFHITARRALSAQTQAMIGVAAAALVVVSWAIAWNAWY